MKVPKIVIFLPSIVFWFLIALIPTDAFSSKSSSDENQSCVWDEHATDGTAYCHEKQLEPIVFDSGEGQEETFLAYVTPDVATFYNATPGSLKLQTPAYQGASMKFINLSKDNIAIYWSYEGGRGNMFLSYAGRFDAASAGGYPNNHFVVRLKSDRRVVLHQWTLERDNSLYVYDPYGSIEAASKTLSSDELELYKLQYNSLKFNEVYQQKTGRQYIALYGRKYPPRHFMWPANSFGQTFQISTKETHIVKLPPIEKLPKLSANASPNQRDFLGEYRTPNQETMTMTMKVLSCAPRVFEIKNFLSLAEVEHLMELATGVDLSASTTVGATTRDKITKTSRTSKNSWLDRESSSITDSIYRRAADLLQIDEAYFRFRSESEATELMPERNRTMAEPLQLVHYDVGQQYKAHCDYLMPEVSDATQASRFATILFYLNDDMEGGQTEFPRWQSAETSESLAVTPEIGKAILFYNQLPDGNYDELSQHAAMPVLKGEKWLANLWVWDGAIDDDFDI